ncbi:MAG: CRISPR-associated endonuclease Cas2 [Alphaproteobacteria bacterium]|nr:CRISPR-associated endonuclease Cas2 [Alphaproteobacteria bacterium]
MWVIVMYDLPTHTRKQMRAASRFRKRLLDAGFQMGQYSIYLRIRPSREHTEALKVAIRRAVPESGLVSVLEITDKQYELMEVFYRAPARNSDPPMASDHDDPDNDTDDEDEGAEDRENAEDEESNAAYKAENAASVATAESCAAGRSISSAARKKWAALRAIPQPDLFDLPKTPTISSRHGVASIEGVGSTATPTSEGINPAVASAMLPANDCDEANDPPSSSPCDSPAEAIRSPSPEKPASGKNRGESPPKPVQLLLF